ncbi:MAG: hypothetical protein JJE25_12030 [Bacteroidia bacterium]|nr:hypothetical protein [Bacteroidia bacterium]
MSYPLTCHVDIILREVLFLILARANDNSICNHIKRCERSVSGYKARLMEKLCGMGDTDLVLIYQRAKSNPELCLALADEFRDKYPALAPIVEEQHTLRIEFTNENGAKELYVWF